MGAYCLRSAYAVFERVLTPKIEARKLLFYFYFFTHSFTLPDLTSAFGEPNLGTKHKRAFSPEFTLGPEKRITFNHLIHLDVLWAATLDDSGRACLSPMRHPSEVSWLESKLRS